MGFTSLVAAPLQGCNDRSYVHEGTQVYRFPCHTKPSPQQVRGEIPHGGFDRFKSWLKQSRADVFHLHSSTYGAGLHHLKWARAIGLRTVVTVHVPEFFCLRGTMMERGSASCDGVFGDMRCAACWLEERGVPSVMGRIVARLPHAVSRASYQAGFTGRLGTVVGAREVAVRQWQRFQALLDSSDAIIAVCGWLYEALEGNGVPAEKLYLIRQGIKTRSDSTGTVVAAKGEVLRIGYFGRLVPVKGVDVLIKAVLSLPQDSAVSVSLHAASNASATDDYVNRLTRLAGGDPRIRFLPPVHPDRVSDVMRTFDVVAVPSVGMETGPMVVMEALSAGVPVLGSRLGGIQELVQEGETGWLCEPDNVEQWAAEIWRLAEAKQSAQHQLQGVSRPWTRTFCDVAEDMTRIYQCRTA
jgi:glycosyltransferase involved in cell wall biosynthesis